MLSPTLRSAAAATRLFAAALLLTTPARAATINVNTTTDGIGVAGISLREAINTANTDGEATTIVLAAGATYNLTVCGTNENANATGDLDHTAVEPLTIEGNGATIVQTCAGDRILHNLAPGSSVVIHDLTITGGHVGLVEFGGGIWMDNGGLELHDSTIIDNEAGESGGGVQMDEGNLLIVGSTFQGNRSGLPGGALEFSSSTATLTVIDSVFHQNEGDLGGAIAVGRTPLLTISGSTFTANEADIGAAAFLGQIDSGLIVESSFESNVGGNAIMYLDTRAPVGSDPPVVFDQCTIAQNDVSGGAAVAIDTNDRALRLRNSTVSGNTGIGIDVTGHGVIDTVHSTIVRNMGFNIQALGFAELRTTATIIADVLGAGGHDCGLSIGADSGGYNFSGDGTCGLGLGPGDVSFGGDPKLAALNTNGGPTRTHAPYADSPVINHVPLAVTTAALGSDPTDQRGVARPVGVACEIGAYEGNLLVNSGAFAVVVVGAEPLPTPGDLVLQHRLRLLGFDLRSLDDDAAEIPPDDLLPAALVLLAPSVDPKRFGTPWRELAVPLLVLEPALFADLGLTSRAPRHAGVSKPTTVLAIVDPQSPLAAGLQGLISPVVAATPFNVGRPHPSADVVAMLGTPRQDAATIFAYETGARLHSLSAPARRVGFFATEKALTALSADGERLFDAAAVWASATGHAP